MPHWRVNSHLVSQLADSLPQTSRTVFTFASFVCVISNAYGFYAYKRYGAKATLQSTAHTRSCFKTNTRLLTSALAHFAWCGARARLAPRGVPFMLKPLETCVCSSRLSQQALNRPAFDVCRGRPASGRRSASPPRTGSALSLSLHVFPRLLGEVMPARALSPGAGGVVGHAGDPHSALELAGAWLGLG